MPTGTTERRPLAEETSLWSGAVAERIEAEIASWRRRLDAATAAFEAAVREGERTLAAGGDPDEADEASLALTRARDDLVDLLEWPSSLGCAAGCDRRIEAEAEALDARLRAAVEAASRPAA